MDGANSAEQRSANALAVAELCHIAGLTAGRAIQLRPGRLGVGVSPSPDGGLVKCGPSSCSFELLIGVDGTVQLIAGSEPVAIEGVRVDRTAHVDDGNVIQLRHDQFLLRTVQRHPIPQPVEPVTPRSVSETFDSTWPSQWWWWLCALLMVLGALLGVQRTAYFGLSLIGLGGGLGGVALHRRRRDRARFELARVRSNATSLFFNQILDRRKFAAEAARVGALDPFEVARRAEASARSIGNRLPITLASGDRSWTPPVVCHRDPGWNHQTIIDELSFLPAIPITMDLAAAPIALTGDRQAALAVARHLVTSALLAAPSDRGVAIDSLVPANWRWLTARSQPMLRVLDGKAGPWSQRTIVIASSPDGLARLGDPRVFGTILEIAVDGSTTITGPEGTFGTGLVAHGITEAHAQKVHDALRPPGPAIDLSDTVKGPWTLDGPSSWFDPSVDTTPAPAVDSHSRLVTSIGADRVMVSGPDIGRNKDVLTSAALLQGRQHPDRTLFILDRGDRALIRLSQLDNCRHYVAIDQVQAVEAMVNELIELHESAGGDVLLVAPDLCDAIAFYRNSGQRGLADRLDALVERMRLLPIASSSQSVVEAPEAAFLVWIDSSTTPMTASVRTTSGATEQQFIDPSQLPGIDLTGSVARLAAPIGERLSRLRPPA